MLRVIKVTMVLLGAILPVGIISIVSVSAGLVSDNLSIKEISNQHNDKHGDSLGTKDRPEHVHSFNHLDANLSSLQGEDEPNSKNDADIQSIEQNDDSLRTNDRPEHNHPFNHLDDNINSLQTDNELNSVNDEDIQSLEQNYDSLRTNDRPEHNHPFNHLDDNLNSLQIDNELNSVNDEDIQSLEQYDVYDYDVNDENELDFEQYDDASNSNKHDDGDLNSKEHNNDDPNPMQQDDGPSIEQDDYQVNSEQHEDYDPSDDDIHDHHTVYELTKEEIKHPYYRYRYDGRCGLHYPLHNGLHGQCDSHGDNPCCSPSGWCGNTDEHCKHGGVDYRGNCGPHLGLWLCADGTCIFIENVCNGKADCIDGSDEPYTCPVHCSVDDFFCGSASEERRCISRAKVCDDVLDCDYGEDELDCNQNDL